MLLKPCVDFGGCDKAKAQKPVEEVTTLGKHGIQIFDVAQIFSDGATGKDPHPKATAQTIRLSVENGVAVKMISGNGTTPIIVSTEGLSLLDPVIKDYDDKSSAANGFAQTNREHKHFVVEGLRELSYRVGMTGNGVNNSLKLKRAKFGADVFVGHGYYQSCSRHCVRCCVL